MEGRKKKLEGGKEEAKETEMKGRRERGEGRIAAFCLQM